MASPTGAGQPPSSENPNPGCQIDDTAPREQQSQEVNSGEREGYDCEFIERPKELQTDCPICLVILREPFQVTCCGYSFCRTCVMRIQADKKSCPTCNEAKFDAFPNKGLRRSLYAFRVRCVHQKSGCEWTGELVQLDRHLNLNPELGKQLIGCEFAAVACTHCCEYVQRRYVHAHQTDSCPQRPFSCDYCDDYGSAYEDVVNNHWPVCKFYPVPCPNKCGLNPERQKVETHVNMQCPLTIVNCDFRYTGCEVHLPRRDMPTHLAENLTTHISLLTTQTQTMAGSGAQGHLAEHLLPHLSLLALHNQQLTRLTIQLKESLEESQRKIQELDREKKTQVAKLSAELQRTSDTSRLKMEKEKQAQAAVNAELQRSSETTKHEMHNLKQEKEALEREVKEEIVQLKKGKLEEMKTLETSLQIALAESESLKQEMAELRRKQAEDRVSVQRYTGAFPVNLMMTNFAEMKRSDGVWYSPPFYTHPQGYKMCLRVDANGNGDGKGTHVSVFAYLMRGQFDDHLKWPFRGHVVIQLCNQLQDKYHRGHTIHFSETTDAERISRVTSGERAEGGFGYQTSILHKDLNLNPDNNCQYLKNDCLHFQIVAVESLLQPGVLPTELTMTEFAKHKIDGDSWFSPPFYTHPQGYKMSLRVDVNGVGGGKGTHVSVYACLMRGEFDDQLEWPFRGHVTLAILSQLEDNNHITKSIRFTNATDSKVFSRVTGGERASEWGYDTFIAHTELNYNPTKNCQYLKYDCLRFRIDKVDH